MGMPDEKSQTDCDQDRSDNPAEIVGRYRKARECRDGNHGENRQSVPPGERQQRAKYCPAPMLLQSQGDSK